MNFVVDASFLARLLLPDEADPATDPIVIGIGNAPLTSPLITQVELMNIMLVSLRRGRITEAEIESLLDRGDRLSLVLQPALSRDQRLETLRLARIYTLTAYDAAYLELAMRLQLPLASLDRQLLAAAKAEDVALALPD